MSLIEFLDAHFLGLCLTIVAVSTINWIGRVVLANTTTKTIERTFSR